MFLSLEDINELQQAAIEAKLSPSALLLGLPHTFVAGITIYTSIAEQFLNDLHWLNSIPQLTNYPTPPLEVWLRNAVQLSKNLVQSTVFRKNLQKTISQKLRDTNATIQHEQYLNEIKDQGYRIPDSKIKNNPSMVRIDIGIITVCESEFNAVLRFFRPSMHNVIKTQRQNYYLCQIQNDYGRLLQVAIVHSAETEPIQACQDLLKELNPKIILAIGIGEGLPSTEFSLGDVIVSTHIYNYVEKTQLNEFSISGGPIERAAAKDIASLMTSAPDFLDWNSKNIIGIPLEVDVSNALRDVSLSQYWRAKLSDSLIFRFDKNNSRLPIFKAGPVASITCSSPDLVMDFLSDRNILAVGMKSNNVFRETYGRVPFISIWGLGSIVGLTSKPDWIQFAARSAASFAFHFLRMLEPPPHITSDLAPDLTYTLPVPRHPPEDILQILERAEVPRVPIIHEVVSGLEQDVPVLVLSPLKMGRSCFGRQLQEYLKENNYDWTVYAVDAHPLRNESPTDFCERMHRTLQMNEIGNRIVACIYGWPRRDREHIRNFAAQLRQYLEYSNHPDHRLFSLVAIGGYELFLERYNDGELSLLNTCNEVTLPDLLEEEVFDMVNSISPGYFSKEEIHEIWEQCGGHPYFIKLVLRSWTSSQVKRQCAKEIVEGDNNFLWPLITHAGRCSKQRNALAELLQRKEGPKFRSLVFNPERPELKLYFDTLLRIQEGRVVFRCEAIRNLVSEMLQGD